MSLVSLIGKPYKLGYEGPDYYDCWGLAKHIQSVMFGRHMPSIKTPPEKVAGLVKFVKTHEARKQWTLAKSYPKHGQLVEMSTNELPFHIGVYLNIDGGGIIHSHENCGVCFDTMPLMKIAGWRRFIYHDWIG